MYVTLSNKLKQPYGSVSASLFLRWSRSTHFVNLKQLYGSVIPDRGVIIPTYMYKRKDSMCTYPKDMGCFVKNIRILIIHSTCMYNSPDVDHSPYVRVEPLLCILTGLVLADENGVWHWEEPHQSAILKVVQYLVFTLNLTKNVCCGVCMFNSKMHKNDYWKNSTLTHFGNLSYFTSSIVCTHFSLHNFSTWGTSTWSNLSTVFRGSFCFQLRTCLLCWERHQDISLTLLWYRHPFTYCVCIHCVLHIVHTQYTVKRH